MGEYVTSQKTPDDLPSFSRLTARVVHWVANSKKKSGGSKRNNKKSPEGKGRELQFAEDMQQYAHVAERLGDGRFACRCLGDGVERLGHVRGKMWKRVWVAKGDLVLVSLRGYQDQKADIVHKFSDDETRTLQQAGEIPVGVLDESFGHMGEHPEDGPSRCGFVPGADLFDFIDPDAVA